MEPIRWAILTGEYPPQAGGVSDYTRLLCRALAAAGDAVHVWSPPCDAAAPGDAGVTVHRLPDHFGPRGRKTLSADLARFRPTRLLVQYVPDAFGMRAMNLPFCFWLLLRAPKPVWIMFHEVAYPWRRDRPRLNVLALVTRGMGAILLAASQRALVSIPAWRRLLQPYNFLRRPIAWLPVASNLPSQAESGRVAALRAAAAGRIVVGHFSSFGPPIAAMLKTTLPEILRADSQRIVRLMGRGSLAFRDELAARNPDLANRIQATGPLETDDAAAALAACDLLFQPYPDGVSSRRSSVMAALALGAAIVTNVGRLSEPIWRNSPAVAAADDPLRLPALVGELLQDPHRRIALAAAAKAFYFDHFRLERTIQILRQWPP